MFEILTVAQVPTPPAGAIENWLICATSIAVGAYYIKRLFTKQPPPHEQFADKKETAERFKKVEGVLEELRKEQSERTKEVHKRLNKILKSLSRLEGRVGTLPAIDGDEEEDE